MEAHIRHLKVGAALLLAVLLAACGDNNDTARQSTGNAMPVAAMKDSADPSMSPGKPSPPINIDYRIVGVPIVGQPVTVELDVSSSLAVSELRVSYQVIDQAGLFLPETQATEALLTELGAGERRSQRVTVIPQAEGRYYLGVMVEMDTPEGLMARAASIPIQVGSVRPVPQVNGELQTDEQGESVISMPAREDQ